MTARIGILSFQGAVQDHFHHLEREHARAVMIRNADELAGIDALILPGGESTVSARFLSRYGMDREIIRLADEGLPIWGICAGSVLLSRELSAGEFEPLGLLPLQAKRNGYGRQLHSGRKMVRAPGILPEPGAAFPFIRAPKLLPLSEETSTAQPAAWDSEGEAVGFIGGRMHQILATAFHPELSSCTSFHRWLIQKAREYRLTAVQRQAPPAHSVRFAPEERVRRSAAP